MEQRLARRAGRQHGVLTRRQLLTAGLSSNSIDRWVKKGRLLRQHPGVYRLGHQAPSVDASYLAAVLACGEGAFLWRPRGRPPPRPPERGSAGSRSDGANRATDQRDPHAQDAALPDRGRTRSRDSRDERASDPC
ncbi:MAG: type IV toxin-antitoxin system AbiEi family antitoxin domain-containing protein [Actinobacteria bacterium]|nr:type IV toxin-antitoxin system AbiEi family antitoxin domain-containing protein [Actinomycetota bacterium]